MDQIYINKKRTGFNVGEYVIITPIGKKPIEKPCFYNLKDLEPIKIEIINKIIKIIKGKMKNENIIITGSFLDKGFKFNDVDIIIIKGSNAKDSSSKGIKNEIGIQTGIKAHIIHLTNKELLDGLSTDPLYRLMLNKCVSKKRLIYNIKKKINYKLLDLHLLKSKILIDSYNLLNGGEKYYFLRNMVAIYLFLENKKISKDSIEKEIKTAFQLDVEKIRQNLIDKEGFIKKYKSMYNEVSNKIFEGVKNGSKQE
ncbi:hypothetical protein HY212_06520 [Candidatus Pacearchaeota archaeon]|nr:hypothetical protein [Candidatus Pacearchaeota archaeon]